MKKLFLAFALVACFAVSALSQGAPPWTIQEVDGSPRVNSPTLIKVTNGTLSCTGKTCTITISGGGGGGSPGGSSTQVQYNAAGSFGGISGFTSDGTNVTAGSGNLRATRPRFITSIDDTNGNEVFVITATGSAVNEFTIANAATGNNPTITASGGDANVGINFIPKGSGTIQVSGVPIVTTTATQTLTNKTLTAPVISTISNTGTLTLPTSTDTLVARATTDTLTNKTYDTAGTGNVFRINGTQITDIAGDTGVVATVTGATSNGNCAEWDANGNLQDSGAACGGGGGGSVTSVFGRTGAVVAATNDYTWAQIDKTTSSLADIATRSASDLSSGTLPLARLSGITNTELSASAAIALSKLAALTASRAAVTDASGVLTASSVTSTELGYLSGVTSAIQTQLGNKQDLDSDLTALAGNSTNGLWARTGAGTGAARTITGTTDKITVTNGDGVSGNPTLTIASTYTGQNTITTLGTITTGTWNGAVIGAAYGGAGTVSGIMKANGSGTVSAAVSGTDYAPATSGSAILKGNGSGGFSSAVAGTDYLAPTGSGASLTNVVNSITGTANQVTASAATGAVTLSLPQDIATTSNTRFGNLGLGVAAPTNGGQISATLGANNITGLLIKRNTDTSPTGNYFDFQNAAGTTVAKLDVAGALTVTSCTGCGGGSGDVVGPASATDNAVVRFDLTTGKLVQNSVVLIGDTGNITGVGTLNTHTIPGGTDTFALLNATQTLANKTFTTPNLGTPSAAVLTNATGLPLTSGVTGTLPVANGGTNLTAATDDNVMVGNGTTWQAKAIPLCTDTGGNHLNYDTATNTFTCGTSSSGGGGGSGANPTASVGLTAVNGVATTFMRSDAAPPLSQSITPTWTGAHLWNGVTGTFRRDSIGTTSTDGLVLENSTAAAAGAQQYSPRLRLTGQGWKTNATAASQTVDWIVENRPVQSTTQPFQQLVFSTAVNGGAYTEMLRMTASASGVPTTPGTLGGIFEANRQAGIQFGQYNMQMYAAGVNVFSVRDSGIYVGAVPLFLGNTGTADWRIIRTAAGVARIGGSSATDAGNLLVGTSAGAIGTSGAGVLAFTLSTAPSTSTTDTVQVYSGDAAAADHNLYARNEAGRINRLTGLAVRNSAQFDVTSSTTLTNVTGLSENVEAGRTYAFRAYVQTSAGAGGIKLAVGGTATATAISYEGELTSASDDAVVLIDRATALATTVCDTTTTTSGTCKIEGVIQVNAAGTLTIQFAQSASNGTASSVLANQYLQLIPIS